MNIRFIYRSSKETGYLTLRLSYTVPKELLKTLTERADKKLDAKTKLLVDKKDFALLNSTSRPHDDDPLLKQWEEHQNIQTSIRRFVKNEFEESAVQDLEIKKGKSNWLTCVLEDYYDTKNNATNSDRSEIVTDFIKEHIALNKGKLAKNTLANFLGIIKRVEDFEIGRKLKFKDFTNAKFNRLATYLETDTDTRKAYASSTIMGTVAGVKSMCKIALGLGLNVADDYHLASYTIPKEEREKKDAIILTPQEIKKVQDLKLNNPQLEDCRKWLLIGVNVGQRGEDLLERVIPSNFHKHEKGYVIDIIQKKGNKPVKIPVLPIVQEIYEKGYPNKMSLRKLNDLLPILCQMAGIDEMVEGSLHEATTDRADVQFRPKYEYIRSHTFRRSFASNFYREHKLKFVMKVTGHEKEETFLKYINKADDSHVDAFLKKKKSKKPKKKKLKVVRNLSS